jgi:SAM-dependent methyltransferase
MFIKLDQKVIDLLCCPLCKVGVIKNKGHFVCTTCATQYPLREVNVGDHSEQVYDFCIQRPSFGILESNEVWNESQNNYESYYKNQSSQEMLEKYLAEIDSVKEIYSQEFHIRGAVLDVGGHQGKLRHFLSIEDVPMYVSIDPFFKAFENIQRQTDLLEAYPCLSQSCNFLAARAEELPFISNSFDWVHMRSVVDHFEDPFKAFKEAFRILKPDGTLLVGLAIMEKIIHVPAIKKARLKLEKEGMVGLSMSILRRFAGLFHDQGGDEEDHHLFRFTHTELKDLLSVIGFAVNKEHWQKPPFNFCIYLSASAKKMTQVQTSA